MILIFLLSINWDILIYSFESNGGIKMSLNAKIVNALKFLYDKNYRWLYLASRGKYNNLDDETFLRKSFECKMGRKLNLDNPQTLNEKLQWLKLYNRKPEYTIMVDKFLVKKYVANIIGEEYIIPTLGVWDDPDDIDFDKLPNQFVLKCNHNSGTGMCICGDKSKLNVNYVKNELRKGLKQDYYLTEREWPYKNVKRKIICEKFLRNNDLTPIVDYKFYCYGGKPIYFMYSIGEASHNVKNHKFDMNLKSIDYLFKRKPTLQLNEIILPYNINKMIKLVEVLSKGLPHIRIDLYNVNGHIFFGEFTFYSGGGYINIFSKEYSNYLSSLIKTSKK